eukprot:CAMPEP_0203771790 /NCGR_PEP_ID=MMETSP0099_2-20121227/3621_1 /ASSEMBLY_ACC=CAM_ASM_000209 /TAXON_ID=96639 /ORGANISM=" , Strain NY0313808BC1" /LENGTH=44 /DNA_ID= /DNA_START= /DNA_END= /DNA_ORIENTATION=
MSTSPFGFLHKIPDPWMSSGRSKVWEYPSTSTGLRFICKDSNLV